MEKRWKILVVDDEEINVDIICATLTKKYDVIAAYDGYNALLLAEESQPDLILLDILIPGMDGFEVCKKLKSNPKTSKIPVIFVTGLSADEDESHGLSVGGVDYLNKPVSVDILLSRISTHLKLNSQRISIELEVKKRTAELLDIQRATIHMLGEAGHYNDTDTGAHIWRMAAFSGVIAKAVGWTKDKVKTLELAAPMHDMGKIGIPDTILKKNASLNKEEWKTMQTHTVIGHNILLKSSSELFLTAADIALYHHEKWDGTGYPVGLKDDQIPYTARIVSIADVFDALTTQRPYKDEWPIERAIEEIGNMRETHFDPFLVDSFMENTDEIIEVKAMWDKEEELTKKRFLFPMEN
jgi:putative two-component system response regulator